MMQTNLFKRLTGMALAVALAGGTLPSAAADKALLDILRENGVITEAQYEELMKKQSLSTQDILGDARTDSGPGLSEESVAATAPRAGEAQTASLDDSAIDRIAASVADALPVSADYTDKGFRLETRDGKWQTNLQWRAQMRYTYPYRGDPRQVSSFEGDEESTFEARRVRMKIGGHGYEPWLKYYFEVDLQPTRDPDESGVSSSARLLDWRIDVAKWDWATLRVGQWKIDLNRERVDSSGRQQFVERSIANRVFTIDRQMGVQLRGRLFKETPADLRYWAGVFTGEGRGVSNNDDNMMYMGRLQWNFMGRDLAWRQTDVEYTEKPTGTLAFGASTNEGVCTRWSSSGCGRLDGFDSPALAEPGQYEIDQYVQEFAFKWRGFSAQQEYHWKNIEDNATNTKDKLTGGYAQVGYFFNNLIPAVPAPLELAFRYARVEEPNAIDRSFDNEREEYTVGLNWFFKGHNNKLTLDWSHLTLDDDFLSEDESDNRVRLQWDISF